MLCGSCAMSGTARSYRAMQPLRDERNIGMTTRRKGEEEEEEEEEGRDGGEGKDWFWSVDYGGEQEEQEEEEGGRRMEDGAG
eukprot:2702332-Rhodomonas_salina.2